MARRIAFGLVLHQHQPVGNLPWVFEEVYNVCYDPLLAVFERHPTIRVNLHYTGSLLDWIVKEHPDYLDRLAVLVQRGQVEMLTGGYYEPILPILPEADQLGQIGKLSGFVKQHFGVEPQGMWLAERVWEPNLPSTLGRAGVRYTIVDDTHLIMAGVDRQDLYGSFVTEDQGYPLVLFPNPQDMRHLIPWKPLREVEATFRRLADEGEVKGMPRIVVMGDDGEKFGSWPGTYERLWLNHGMDRFMEMLERNADWLETVKLTEYLREVPPQGLIYVPSASYNEMMEWALPADRSAQLERLRRELQDEGDEETQFFLHGGSWRNFAVKYPETNTFHKKMLRIHEKIRAASARMTPAQAQEAWEQLWQGQCNCGYWHGAFGGVYIADIRSAIYQHLIAAEALADAAMASQEPTVSVVDFDQDGYDEILLETPRLNLAIAPHDGGTIFELDCKVPTPFNLVDTLARRPEAYHTKLRTSHIEVVSPADRPAVPDPRGAMDEWGVRLDEAAKSIHDIVQAKEAGLERWLVYDTYRRTVLRDHFLGATTTLDQFSRQQHQELGDFATGDWFHRLNGVGTGILEIALERTGSIQGEKQRGTLTVQKTIMAEPNAAHCTVRYRLQNTGNTRIATRFAIETNWGMVGGQNPHAWYLIDGQRPVDQSQLDGRGSAEAVTAVTLCNQSFNIKVDLATHLAADLWRFPIETISNSDGGFERSYQCSCVVFLWNITLHPGEIWQNALTIAPNAVEDTEHRP